MLPRAVSRYPLLYHPLVSAAPTRVEPPLDRLVTSNSPALPLAFIERKSTRSSSGRNCGQRCVIDNSTLVSADGCPPFSETLANPPVNVGAKTMVPFEFHAPPRPSSASQRFWMDHPTVSSFFSFPGTKKATLRLSGDQNGYAAPSVSSTRLPRIACKGRIQRLGLSFPLCATYANIFPSGDNAIESTSGRLIPSPKSMDVRITCFVVCALSYAIVPATAAKATSSAVAASAIQGTPLRRLPTDMDCVSTSASSSHSSCSFRSWAE